MMLKHNNFFSIIVICAISLAFRQAATRLPSTLFGLPAIWQVSVLQIWVWYELALVSVREPAFAGPWTYAMLTFFYAFCLSLYPDIIITFLLFSAILLMTLYGDRICARVLSLSFGLIVFAGLLTSSLFHGIHSTWAYVDAKVVWASFSLIGMHLYSNQTVLQLPGSNHSIIVEATCSSTWVLVLPIISFGIITFCRQGSIAFVDFRRLLLTIFLIFALNILRLAEMLPSRQAWEYWHFGTGSSIFAFATAMIVALLVRSRPNEDKSLSTLSFNGLPFGNCGGALPPENIR